MAVFENNRDLLKDFRAGDKAALAAVYHYYVEQVCVLVQRGFVISTPTPMRIVGAPRGCEQGDLVQDVFVRVFTESARYGYDGLRPFRPYLLRIARNLMIDRHRSSRCGLAAETCASSIGDIDVILAQNGPFAPETRAPDEQLHWEHLSRLTQEYVRSLDMESQRFVNYRFEQCLSQDAVADEMGLSRRRVRTLEASIQRGLRSRLRRSGVHETSIAWAPAS